MFLWNIFNLPDLINRLKYYPTIVPPRHLRRSKDIKDFLTDGQIQLRRLVKYAELDSKSNILDIGCGGGKLVSTLASVIKEGAYSTFEVNKNYTEFWKNSIAKKYKNFTFIHADLQHSYYNPTGKLKTAEYVFPYNDNAFDIVYLNSIFTHLLPSEISHYLTEIRRVLKPEGIVLATYFIVNKESLLLDSQGLSSRTLIKNSQKLLNYQYDNYWTRDEDEKERLVGLDEEWLKNTYKQKEFEITNIIYGTWCGRKEITDKTLQDIIVARKRYQKLSQNSFQDNRAQVIQCLSENYYKEL